MRLHPANPHYFEFRGRPTVLVSSAEHYGAVLNPDFDYRRYVRALARDKLTLTRIFTGSMVVPEDALASSGLKTTLGPAAGRLLAPWARSDTPGYAWSSPAFVATGALSALCALREDGVHACPVSVGLPPRGGRAAQAQR
ncbi:MAG: hypothetical protein ACRDGE_11900 [Candidatus Limnocylindria bacterium]